MAPIKITAEFHPETGSKRPYEMWYYYASGNKRRAASYKTEEAANKAVDEAKKACKLT